jgi:hypothetical protein
LLCLKIGKLKELALTHLLLAILVKDFSLSNSLLFTKYIALQLLSKVLAKSKCFKKSSVVYTPYFKVGVIKSKFIRVALMLLRNFDFTNL